MLLSDRSITQAKPTKLALFIFTISEHSIADFPVVITSSTISTLESCGIANPLLNVNLLFDLSAKIVSQIKIKIAVFKENELPDELKKTPAVKPGSRNLSNDQN